MDTKQDSRPTCKEQLHFSRMEGSPRNILAVLSGKGRGRKAIRMDLLFYPGGDVLADKNGEESC